MTKKTTRRPPLKKPEPLRWPHAGRGRTKNPGAQTLAQWVRAVNTICRKRDAKKGICSPSQEPEVLEAVALIRATPAAKRREFAKEQGSRRGFYRRENPELAEIETKAEQLFEAFTGKPATEFREVEEVQYHHSTLADLGELRELQVILPTGTKLATIDFKGRGIRTAAAGVKKDRRGIYGTELHLVGGNQTLDLDALQARNNDKPTVAIGDLYKITYYTSKHFHDFKPSEYEHELGEETGDRPLLAYDVRSRKMFVVGGAYQIRPEGIVN
jgi:hypothetical protein